MVKLDECLACIRCTTYNQSAYVTDALNGFCLQRTSFPFYVAVFDDASTDSEQEVISAYMDVHFDHSEETGYKQWETEDARFVFARHKENKNCCFLIIYLIRNLYRTPRKYELLKEWCNAKYIALCEGDDYWTDPLKLQKQVDFLEAHPDYSLCCHRFKIYHERTDTWSDDYVGAAFAEKPGAEGLNVCNADNFRTRFTQTLTLCYRKSAADSIVWHPYKLGKRDFTFHYHLLKAGKGWCMADYMGVYRMNDGGVWARKSPVEMDKLRLDGYEDFYSYHRDDPDVVSAYQYWLDRFFHTYVFPPFSRHRITRDGINFLVFASGHAIKVKGMLRTMAKWVHCFMLFAGFAR